MLGARGDRGQEHDSSKGAVQVELPYIEEDQSVPATGHNLGE